MNRSTNAPLLIGAFLLGLFAIAWVGFGFIGTSSWLALGMTVAIAVAYLVGALEIRRFRSASTGLAQALAQLPQPLNSLADWLARVPAPLQNAVRQRVESGRGALPGLSLTPYLIGLLVMLGSAVLVGLLSLWLVTSIAVMGLNLTLGYAGLKSLAQAPGSFAELALKYSACPSKAQGGSLGQVSKGQTVPELERQLFTLAPGLAAKPLESRYGWHVISVDQRIEGQPLPYEAVAVAIRTQLQQGVWQKALVQYLQTLIGAADIRGIRLQGADSPLVQ